MVADEPVAELIDPPLVSLHDRIEGIAPSRLRKLYELGVIHALHSTGLDRNARRKSHGCFTDRLTFAFSLHIVRAMLPLTKRQREILDYLNDFIQQHGYAPSLEEIGRRFQLSSLATVHKHLSNLQEKGFIKRAWNRSRSVEMVPARLGGRAVELPMLGYVAAGSPIEAVVGSETLAVPEDLVGKRDSYVLRVKGDSMIDEQIRDGDFVIVEDRHTADNGEMVIALLNGSDVTLKKLYREHGRIRLQPANPTMQPIYAEAGDVQVRGVVIGVMRRY
jgi:repressor LexA